MDFSYYINRPILVRCNPNYLLDNGECSARACNYTDVRIGCDLCGNGFAFGFKLNITHLSGLPKISTRAEFPTKVFDLQELRIVPKKYYPTLPFYHLTTSREAITELRNYFIQFQADNESCPFDSSSISSLTYDSDSESYRSTKFGLTSQFDAPDTWNGVVPVEAIDQIKLCPICYHWIIKVPSEPKITKEHFIRVHPLQIFWADFFADEIFIYENPQDHDWIMSQLRFRDLDLIYVEIMTALMDKNWERLQTIFTDNGAFVNLRNPKHLLHHIDDLESVQFLLKWGASVQIYDDQGNLPIHSAIQRGNLEVFQELLRHSKGSLLTKSKQTLLHVACNYNKIAIVKELILLGLDLNAKDDVQDTPLHLAKYPCAVELLKYNINPNIVNRWGRTPLHIAVKDGHLDHVKSLVSAGADIFVTDGSNNTPYEIAMNNHHNEIAEYLKAYEDGFSSIKSAID